MNLNEKLIEKLSNSDTNSHFNPKYDMEINIICVILNKNYGLSYSQISKYIKIEYEIDIPRQSVITIIKRTAPYLEKKIKTDKNSKNYDWYPFYIKSPIKSGLFEKEEAEDAYPEKRVLGYQEDMSEQPEKSVKNPTKTISKEEEKQEKNSKEIPEKTSDIQLNEEELNEEENKEPDTATSQEKKPVAKKKRASSSSSSSPKKNDSPTPKKTEQKTKKETSTPLKPPSTGNSKTRQNSAEKKEEPKNNSKSLINNNENKNHKEGDSECEVLECEVIGRPTEDILEVKKSLQKKEKMRRQRVGRELRLRLQDGEKLSTAEMKMLYQYTRVNRIETSKDIEKTILPELIKMFGEEEVDKLLKKENIL